MEECIVFCVYVSIALGSCLLAPGDRQNSDFIVAIDLLQDIGQMLI